MLILALGAAFTAAPRAAPALAGAKEIEAVFPHQLVYQEQTTLPDGRRVGIFLPGVPIALGLESHSGPKILTIGDILNCKSAEEEVPMFRKAANGEFEPFTGKRQLLNCGPMVAGGEDRVLAIVAIQWRQK